MITFIRCFLFFSSLTCLGQNMLMDKLKGMEFRSIGPAGMSGRVTCIDVVASQPDVIYIGSASGGVWKSTNRGNSWVPIFDTYGPMSVGSIAIDKSNPDVIWVGTGEGNPRNSQSSGAGIYKTLDAGKTWKFLGLAETKNIHRIAIHPDNSDVVFVGVQGSAWGTSAQRGVYKTLDGGKSWKKILYVDEDTGVADMVMDPKNPNKLLVAMWEFRRYPYFFTSGGKKSGLYITLDGGEEWKKLSAKEGLPKGELGRIGLAIAPSNTNRIYALIESHKNALYQSLDGGKKWEKISDKNIGNRPFYYADIYVDPVNELRIYNLYSVVSVSDDGGKNFRVLLKYDRESIHPDHHAWWIHPTNPNYIMEGNDGGLAISEDRGKSWRHIENLPLAQFYHINVDLQTPYNVMGGMQDNGSWRGPSYVWKNGDIRNSYWQEVSFGDGFDVIPDLEDDDYVFTMWQGGNLLHSNIKTGKKTYISPLLPDGTPLRYNWNAAIAQSPFDKKTIYYGSQFLHKSSDGGKSWETLSPDLSTNDTTKQKQLKSGGLTYDVTNAENYTTITAIAPSKINKEVLWVGTDDGNIQLTKDGGKSWENVAKNSKDMPKNGWVTQIHPSVYDQETAVVVMNNYRQGDEKPYLFQTQNFGKNWKSMVDEKQIKRYVLSFVQDFVEKDLMFLGTEQGLYLSIDGGKQWNLWNHSYPTVSTMDMVIHPVENDLVIGTFGRAAYILDDITPLRALARTKMKIFDKQLHVFPPPKTYQVFYNEATGLRFMGDAVFQGKNRSYGTRFTYYLKQFTDKMDEKGKKISLPEKDTVKIVIKNAQNIPIRTIRDKAMVGVNRVTWDLSGGEVRFPNVKKPKKEKEDRRGMPVLAGEYKAIFYYGKDSMEVSFEVLHDPRTPYNMEEAKIVDDYMKKYEKLVTKTTKIADDLRGAKKFIQQLKEHIDKNENFKELFKLTQSTEDSINKIMKLIEKDKNIQGYVIDTTMITFQLRRAGFILAAAAGQLNETQKRAFLVVEKKVSDFTQKINKFIDNQWVPYEEKIKKENISFFPTIIHNKD